MSYRNSDTYSDYPIQVVRITQKAILVKFIAVDRSSDPETWIPKSVCQNSDQKIEDLNPGDHIELRIADWFAKKEGFL